MPKPFSLKNSSGTIQPIAGMIRVFIPFPRVFAWKVSVIARLEYELAYYDSAVHRFNHYTTRTPPDGILYELYVTESIRDIHWK